MQKTNRQLLIALFSAFCLLWLSAINAVQASTTLPNHQPMSEPNPTVTEVTQVCPEQESSSPHTSHHAKVEHQSCSSFCVMKIPFEPSHHALQIAPSAIALIGQEQIAKAISRVQTLFRPPIHLALIDSFHA
ncbi:hypothetical protein BIY21_00045 [Vibrio ponticus]|uniref:DUF2946 domain-containing protein n=1 Tax=Vibrio ponticus TaxID=265668 RepID=A0ABX3FJ59_9VIBR|nr:hypothetical protein [Vibrio ponticus]OLQ94226.1 hypothetical protein BIY21_00045 [Vibrio ponticus]